MKKIVYIFISTIMLANIVFAQPTVQSNSDCDEIIIDNGTTLTLEIPIHMHYRHSYTQQIYDAEEIVEIVL